MINKSLSILAGGLYFAVAAALALFVNSWWSLPFIVSITWLGSLLVRDAVAGTRRGSAVPLSRQPECRGHDGTKDEPDPNRRLAA